MTCTDDPHLRRHRLDTSVDLDRFLRRSTAATCPRRRRAWGAVLGGRAPTGPACSVDNGPCACTPTGTKDTRAGRSDLGRLGGRSPRHERLSLLTYPPGVLAREPARLWTVVLAVAGGLLTRLAFPAPGWWGTAFVGVALLYLALRRDSARWNALVGFLWGLALFLPLITWADEAVGLVPWLALSTLEAGYFALFGAAWSWARRGNSVWRNVGLQVTVFTILFVATEELAAAWPFGGFPWGRLAFSQADSPLASLASLAGTPLLTAAVVVVGVLLARVVLAAPRLRVGEVVASASVAVAVLVVGLLVPLDTQAQSGSLRVGAVQGDVPGTGLDAFGQRQAVLDNHVSGTLALLDRVEPGELDLVLWPENGTDIDPQVDQGAADLIDGAARAVGAPMLVGTVQYPDSGGRYNTAVLWEPGAGVTATYTKQHPAPFAEYIPIRSFVRQFSSAVDLVTRDMLPGDRPGYVPLDSERLGRSVGIGDVICFEVAYDGIVRDAVRTGGEVLVVQTNNASFGVSDESTQQLAMSRIRAIEHGRATVQISTVGVSAVIEPNGVVSQQTGLFTAEQMVASLPLRDTLTPATRLGSWPAWIIDALAVCVVLAGAAGARRVRRADRIETAV
ncbi:apolipoprotein N-acyltransferase [Cellulomonas sp. zg-ZUI188]|uniref:Apolipoprotein N-acyltransferase n=1 Tax=Cellulomonas fengjieae TaxID=2819978 RepID=A0ABS3SJT1_9CELL|nr:apolipoprotein N-acyltransferase [Cellulomonas fengjieae]QVI67686.1 apolipoprotein N-acyltransferase [Cellulomonas fengjieae]